jgi:hypothetical protein
MISKGVIKHRKNQKPKVRLTLSTVAVNIFATVVAVWAGDQGTAGAVMCICRCLR